MTDVDLGPFGPDVPALRDVDADPEHVDLTAPDDREVEAIQIPAGISPDAWRRALTVYVMFWNREGRVPTPRNAWEYWDRIPLKTYERIAAEPEFQRALELRGVDYDPAGALSDLQVSAIMKLTDPGDRRTDRAKLRDLGISWPRYQGWLNQPLFLQEKKRMAERTFADVADAALVKLRGNVESGDQRAIEFALEVTGRYNRQSVALADARMLVTLVAESVIRNVKDEQAREAILGDVREALTGSSDRKAIGQ